MDSDNRLSPKQERFCEEYVVDYNAGQAAKRAGYSEKAAPQIGCRLLKNANILARVRELQAEQAERLAITSDWTMVQLRECVMRCMQKTPVLEWDPEAKEMVETGEWQFDSKGAAKALELIGRHLGMFEGKAHVTIDIPRVVDDIG